MPSKEEVLQALSGVMDPEVPVLSVVELGVIRDVEIEGDAIRVQLTPTYSGCPALEVMERNIIEHLESKGYPSVTVETVFSPPWTTDWLTDEAKTKLRDYGIAPPGLCSAGDPLDAPSPRVSCPFCGSNQTELRNRFGSTACKALFYCDQCRQPFEHFKCH